MKLLSQTHPLSSHQQTIENLFSLAIIQKQTSAKIVMQTLNNQISTGNIPFIVEILKEHLPNVLLTQCFNEENLPFKIEVKNTEIGHLFEHILLEYMCQLKISKGSMQAMYRGRTRWNWVRDPRGKFHISLNCGADDADILPLAIEKTNALMKIIYEYSQSPLFTKRLFTSRFGLKNGRRLRRRLSKKLKPASPSQSIKLFKKSA